MLIIKNNPTYSNFQETEAFKAAVIGSFSDIDNEVNIPINISHQNMYHEINNLFKAQNETNFLARLSELEQLHADDQTAMQALSIAYHTWYFWKNLPL